MGLDHVAKSGGMVLRDSYINAIDKHSERLFYLETKYGNLYDAYKQLTGIDVVKLKQDVTNLSESLDNRREEIDGVIETLQNLDNHEVITDLHKRISELENKSKVAE